MSFLDGLNPSNWGSLSDSSSPLERLQKSLMTGGVSDLTSLGSDWDRLNGGGARPPSASEQFAALTRDQWRTYVKDIIPYENKLIEYATDPAQVTTAMSKASTSVNDSFDRQGVATQERLQGLGMKLNADEQKASDRSTALSRSLADVGAQNMVGDQVRARQRAIIGNPTPNLGSLPT